MFISCILKIGDFYDNIEFVTETWHDDKTAEVGETRSIGKTSNCNRIVVVEEIFFLTFSNPSFSCRNKIKSLKLV